MKNCCLFSIFRRLDRCGQALNRNAAKNHRDWCPKTGVAPLGCRHRLQPRACRRPRLRYALSSNGRHCRGLAGRAGSHIILCGTSGRRAGAIAGEVFMHDTPDRRPLARAQGRRERRLRQVQAPAACPMTASWRRRACRSIAASACAGCRICRWCRGSGSAAAARYIQLYGTEGLWGLLRRRGARRRRAQCRAASLRKGRARGRRPRHHRGLAGRPDQAPRLRMAEGLAVHDSAQRLSPHRQCGELAGACCCAAPRRRT